MIDVKKEVLAAESRIRSFIRETPLDYSVSLSKITGCQVFLKCENLQHTGSFKVRGALNKLLSLTPAEREQGIVTASTGNHAAAIAFGLNKLKIPGMIFVPENASLTKLENIRQYDIPVEQYSNDCMETELYARAYATQHNRVYISPYNDPQVIGGQGTIALEIERQLDNVDMVFVPIGGGGLISGIAGYLKTVSPKTKIIGCLPENSPIMSESIKAGKIIDLECKPTLSDATAGNMEPGSITFDICQQYVDDYILVSENEIKNAISALIKTQHYLIEGGAGVGLAALLQHAPYIKNKNIVVILSGANIGLETLKTILA